MANILELSSSVRSVFEQHPNTYISAIEIAEQINSTKESVLEVLNNQNYIKSRIFENNGEAVYIVKTIINRVRETLLSSIFYMKDGYDFNRVR